MLNSLVIYCVNISPNVVQVCLYFSSLCQFYSLVLFDCGIIKIKLCKIGHIHAFGPLCLWCNSNRYWWSVYGCTSAWRQSKQPFYDSSLYISGVFVKYKRHVIFWACGFCHIVVIIKWCTVTFTWFMCCIINVAGSTRGCLYSWK